VCRHAPRRNERRGQPVACAIIKSARDEHDEHGHHAEYGRGAHDDDDALDEDDECIMMRTVDEHDEHGQHRNQVPDCDHEDERREPLMITTTTIESIKSKAVTPWRRLVYLRPCEA
jgi:hypothetical protein